jgi:co-chaperonin GroES (HSP10)
MIDPKKITPVSNRVLIQKHKKSDKIGSILIPENEKSKRNQITGVVISVGCGKDGEKMTVKKDDVVMFGVHSGTSLGSEEEGLIIMEEHHILCIVGK